MAIADLKDHPPRPVRPEPLDRFPPRVHLLAAALLAAATLLLLGAAWMRGVPLLQVLDDPASFYDESPLSGLVSYAGIWLMNWTAAVCAFAAHIGARQRGLLVAVAGFSIYFALDDLLMLHEAVWPRLGIPEGVIMVGLGSAVLAISARAWAVGRPNHPWGLYLALALMGGSIVIDQGVTPDGSNETGTVIEDVLKFMGLGIWALFWMGAASGAVSGKGRIVVRP